MNKTNSIFSLLLFICVIVGCSPVSVTAEYGDMEFGSVEGKSFHTFRTGDYHRTGFPVAKVYLTVESAKPIFLPELQLEEAQKFFGEPEISQNIHGTEIQRFSIGEHSRIVFREGKVAHCSAFVRHKNEIAIGRSESGPFLDLPIGKRDLIRIFGSPKSYRTSYGKGLRP